MAAAIVIIVSITIELTAMKKTSPDSRSPRIRRVLFIRRCPSIHRQRDPLRPTNGSHPAGVNRLGHATSNQRLLERSSTNGWAICAQSLTVSPRCGKLPPKHSRAHLRIAKPRPSLSTRKCRRMARQTFGSSSANALQPAGRRMPGWLGKRRTAVMFSIRHSTGPHARRRRVGKRNYQPLYAYAGRRNSAPLQRSSLKTSRLRSSLVFESGPSVGTALCFWRPQACRVFRSRPVALAHCLMRSGQTASDGLAIALAEAAVDRVHLLSRMKAVLALALCLMASCAGLRPRSPEQSGGRVALRRQNPRLPLCFQSRWQLHRRSGLPRETHFEFTGRWSVDGNTLLYTYLSDALRQDPCRRDGSGQAFKRSRGVLHHRGG